MFAAFRGYSDRMEKGVLLKRFTDSKKENIIYSPGVPKREGAFEAS